MFSSVAALAGRVEQLESLLYGASLQGTSAEGAVLEAAEVQTVTSSFGQSAARRLALAAGALDRGASVETRVSFKRCLALAGVAALVPPELPSPSLRVTLLASAPDMHATAASLQAVSELAALTLQSKHIAGLGEHMPRLVAAEAKSARLRQQCRALQASLDALIDANQQATQIVLGKLYKWALALDAAELTGPVKTG